MEAQVFKDEDFVGDFWKNYGYDMTKEDYDEGETNDDDD